MLLNLAVLMPFAPFGSEVRPTRSVLEHSLLGQFESEQCRIDVT
ncbi:MAG: hypothetical protein ACI9UU_003197 [Candidatus Azotimanducaceae bacterium]